VTSGEFLEVERRSNVPKTRKNGWGGLDKGKRHLPLLRLVSFAFGKGVVGLVKWLAVEMNSSTEIGKPLGVVSNHFSKEAGRRRGASGHQKAKGARAE
jgi:hypothetical protein